ncbi:hypothetical protein N7463_010060 [Penicillium fimorum]|uniref:Uncharacterized protein n=1 Tax=Penicillium fimorum TaxID=1882269 RepID=A0A9X0C0X1_9EURO|nr:hypothetical protein N7463_010060 [Penicillium fimorum]
MVARSKDLTPAIRERICELHSIGWGYKRIHTRYPAIPLSTIRYTVKKESERREGVSKPRSGRPKKLTEADKDRLLNAIHGDPKITAEDMLTEVNHKCTVERGIGVRREWTFIRPKDQPREGQCQGLPHRGKQVRQMFWAAFSGAIRRTGLIPLFGDPNAEPKIYELRPDLLHMGNNDTTKEILVATAQQAWDELELRHLKHLSETMPHRVEAIIESQGWYTPY